MAVNPPQSGVGEPGSDEEIVRRVCAGEEALFEVLMRRHNQRVYRAARAILRNDVEAEDVMQDAYVRAYEHLRSNPEQQLSDVEIRALLEKAVETLSDDFHAVFVLRAIEGMSGAETAECLGVSEDVVKTRLSRARRRLREALLESIEPSLPAVYEFHLSRCDRVVAAVLRRIETP